MTDHSDTALAERAAQQANEDAAKSDNLKALAERMNTSTHTSNIRLAKRLWLDAGGRIEQVRCTGEVRYIHPRFEMPLRVNDSRKDVPAKLLSRLNQLGRAASTSPPL